MTITHFDTQELQRTSCAECDNDTFHADMVLLPSGAARIKQIVCAICGETTEFVTSQPRDLVSA